jgi:hypothetical protein
MIFNLGYTMESRGRGWRVELRRGVRVGLKLLTFWLHP